MRNAVVLCFVVCALAASAIVSAHHGYAGFFDPKERTMAVEGYLVSLVYGNPMSS